jgi:hypothetical protein
MVVVVKVAGKKGKLRQQPRSSRGEESEMDAIRQALLNGEISSTDDIKVEICNGPAGANGFRKGDFPVRIGHLRFSVYACVPHELSLNEQADMVRRGVQRFLGHAREKTSDGKYYRYTSQSKRK